MAELCLAVNGADVCAPLRAGASLLDFLREDLGLTGTKSGCLEGECGACAVWLDGRLVDACLVPAVKAAGAAVTTIEGLSPTDGALHPAQEAFLQAGAVQCGICIPGMVMATAALLDANPAPTRAEAQAWLAGNLCRCTGYTKILDAVLLAARFGRDGRRTSRASGAVGRPVVRVDAEAKVRGTALYADDYQPAGCLQLQIVRSPHAYAELLAVETEPALARPGVVGVLTAADVPGQNGYGILVEDQPVFCDMVVRYAGDAVAAVVAETRAAADAAARAVRVHYRPLPALLSADAARRADAPRLHPAGNLLARPAVRKGDVARGLGEAAVVVEGTWQTQWIEHAYIEPEAGVAYREADGTITLVVSTQTPYMDRDATAKVLGLPPAGIRVIQAVTGGGFGGKLDLSIQPYLALAVAKFGRPVKCAFSREESVLATVKRHPYEVRMRLGADAGGRFTAVAAEISGDTGAYASWGPTVITRACIHASGPYAVPHVQARGFLWYTNNPPAGAMRGFSTPQVAVATEGAIDLLALELGVDPIELRLRNALRRGSLTATGQALEGSVGLVETLEAVRDRRRELAARDPLPAEDGPWVLGEGVASMWYGIGNTALSNPAEVRVELEADGRVHLATSAADIGQGSSTILGQVLAETLGCDLDRIRLTTADTRLTPDSGKTSASRVAFIVGNAVRDAGQALVKALVGEGAGLLGVAPDRVRVRGGRVERLDGGGAVGLDAVARAIRERDGQWTFRGYFDPATTPLDADGQGVPYQTYAFATQLAQLYVNRETGEVRVRRVIAAHDLGRAINPQAAEGQIEGGVVMGLGFALTEEYVPGRTLNFSTYLIPTALEVPEIVPILVESDDPFGPFGAKGVGEPAMIATAPAVLNAISRAIGRRIWRLPATPERVFQTMRGDRGA
ncbi:MAG TPA: molybdopterin cofactor-binding domain-containing protein [Methylomirabilota bacterium]|nr:molybdopterin cofactor-binding domain-containing protein [Methylomirabilota bacterium]